MSVVKTKINLVVSQEIVLDEALAAAMVLRSRFEPGYISITSERPLYNCQEEAAKGDEFNDQPSFNNKIQPILS